MTEENQANKTSNDKSSNQATQPQQEKELLDVDGSYVPHGGNFTAFNNITPSMKTVVHYLPEQSQDKNSHYAKHGVPAALPLILAIAALATTFASYFTFYLLNLASVALSIVAIGLGERAKLTKGCLATFGAALGIFSLCVSIISIAYYVLLN